MPKPAKATAVVFVTDRIKDKPSVTALLANDDPSESPVQFAPPAVCPIQIPNEFQSSWLRSNMFRLACHEVSHSLAGLLFAGRIDGVVLTEIDGGGAGRSYGYGGFGEDGARVGLAGIAGERLVQGKTLPMEGFRNDVETARKDLRDAGTPEDCIDAKMQEIYQQLQHTFQSWLPAIVDAATALTNRGILDGTALFRIFSAAQENADEAGRATFTKSFQSVQIGDSKGEYYQDVVRFANAQRMLSKAQSSPFTAMAEQLDHLARDNDLHKAAVLDRAASLKGLTAHEVSKLEVLRNRAATRARGQ